MNQRKMLSSRITVAERGYIGAAGEAMRCIGAADAKGTDNTDPKWREAYAARGAVEYLRHMVLVEMGVRG